MIKPFEFIKVSSVCTVPNARNTRRSTALGETPLIWYCARYPEPSDPTVDSLLGAAVACGEEVCIIVSLFSTVQQLLPPPCRVLPSSFGGGGGLAAWRESKFVLKKGVRLVTIQMSFAAIGNNRENE